MRFWVLVSKEIITIPQNVCHDHTLASSQQMYCFDDEG